MNKMREEFENWAVKERGYSIERFESEPQQYVEQDTHIAWTAWKASREHLVIDLPIAPSVAMYVTVDEAKAARDAHFRVVKALEEQGMLFND